MCIRDSSIAELYYTSRHHYNHAHNISTASQYHKRAITETDERDFERHLTYFKKEFSTLNQGSVSPKTTRVQKLEPVSAHHRVSLYNQGHGSPRLAPISPSLRPNQVVSFAKAVYQPSSPTKHTAKTPSISVASSSTGTSNNTKKISLDSLKTPHTGASSSSNFSNPLHSNPSKSTKAAYLQLNSHRSKHNGQMTITTLHVYHICNRA
eukprot:TRINITY_DN15032_c0_g1_i2.p1 TRINITY_DN15032_c0_g1~~TRINITY_DN15032_c0_g1_i2.p1  ORF type:complete len:208 (-),score=3.65 TRINITY_DN15032_c0_g1_i2:324-947(-)